MLALPVSASVGFRFFSPSTVSALPHPRQYAKRPFTSLLTCTGVHPTGYGGAGYYVGGSGEDVPWDDDATGRSERSWKV